MGDDCTKNHTASGRLLLATSLKHPGLLRESVLDVDVPLLQDADAVARDHHVLRRIHVHLDHDGAVYFPLDARRRIFAAHAAGLVEHMWRDTAEIRADENLKGGRLVVANEANDRESITGSILHGPSRTFRLIAGSVLLLRLTDDLQLHLPICGSATCKLKREKTSLRFESSRIERQNVARSFSLDGIKEFRYLPPICLSRHRKKL